jgi:hypothetical protein
MSRSLTFALTQLEMPRLVFPSLAELRVSFSRATAVQADAAAMFAANETIRSSSRGWMV